MNTLIQFSHKQQQDPQLRDIAPIPVLTPPKWDSVVAQSRSFLPSILNAVLGEVFDGPAPGDLTGTGRIRLVLGTLLNAYTIGIFSSREIETTDFGKNHQGAKAAAPSAEELKEFRQSHTELLTRCLARVYSLAWETILRRCENQLLTPMRVLTAAEYWRQALAEARDRLEWAYFSDLTDTH